MLNEKKEENAKYGITVRAETEVELVVFNRFDALTRFKTNFDVSKYLSWNASYLRDLYREQMEERLMHREKAKILDGIIRERRGDPTLHYVGNLAKAQKPLAWKY